MNKINSGPPRRIIPKLPCPTIASRAALEPADCDFDWGFHHYHPQQHEIQDTTGKCSDCRVLILETPWLDKDSVLNFSFLQEWLRSTRLL
jgi:hypothetical protein